MLATRLLQSRRGLHELMGPIWKNATPALGLVKIEQTKDMTESNTRKQYIHA